MASNSKEMIRRTHTTKGFRGTVSRTLAIVFGLFFLLTSYNGCEKELPFDPEFDQSKLVVNALFRTDSSWRVHISRSLSVLDTSQLVAVEDATVRISDGNGNTVANLDWLGDGEYGADSLFPMADQNYRIDISAPGYEPISASDYIPGTVQIISLDTFPVWGPDSTKGYEFELTFTDPAGADNYYEIQLLQRFTWIFGNDTLSEFYPVYIICEDPNIETDNGFEGSGFENYYDAILLKDDQIEGQTYTLRFSIEDVWIEPLYENAFALNMYSTSESFFNYRRSLAAYNNVLDNPFAQPVQVFSNVTGGYGIFAGGALEQWIIDL